MVYTIKEYLYKVGIVPARTALALQFYEENKANQFNNWAEVDILNFIKKHDFKVEVPDNLMKSLKLVNKMVKHSSCPPNYRNKFYTHKHKLLKYMYEHKKVNETIDSDSVIGFKIGEQIFHQPKDRFKDIKQFDRNEPYIRKHTGIPFSIREFNKVINGIARYIHTNCDCESFHEIN